METAPDTLVSELIVHLREENAAESGDYIDQLWIAQEGEPRALCHLAGGEWRQVGIWVWERTEQIFYEETVAVLQPDLTNYQRVY